MTTELLPFEAIDLAAVEQLRPDGWPDIVPAFNYYVTRSFCFPLKLLISGQLAATGAYILHGDTAWLAHIIVKPDYRNQGLGRMITETLMKRVKEAGYKNIQLIATDLGAPVYEKLGFETETEYVFYKDVCKPETGTTSKCVLSYSEAYKEQIMKMDLEVSGEDRFFHIASYLHNGLIYVADNVVEGYYLPAFGEGLIIAKSQEAGLDLMTLRLENTDKVAFPSDNKVAEAFMSKHNHRPFKTAKRMRLGSTKKWQPAAIFNRIGGNLG